MNKKSCRLRGAVTACLAGMMMASLSFTAYAQSAGIFEYSDTYTTDGTTKDFWTTDDIHWNTGVCELNNRDFTITVNCQDLTDNVGMPYYIDMVWVGKIEDSVAFPITSNPWEDSGIPVSRTGENTYSLAGLNIESGAEYGFFAELISDHKPGAAQGGGYATYATFFKVNGTNTTGTSGTETSDSNNDISSVSYYWANNAIGWWVQGTDGTYLTNCWYQSPASGLWYYMGADGYMLTNTTTPDGYYVNGEGVWTQS